MAQMTDRLPSCNKWHPQVEPDFTTWAPSGRQRNPRRICRLCKRIRYGRNVPTSKEKPFVSLGKPYGVIPLKWKPPEEICQQ